MACIDCSDMGDVPWMFVGESVPDAHWPLASRAVRFRKPMHHSIITPKESNLEALSRRPAPLPAEAATIDNPPIYLGLNLDSTGTLKPILRVERVMVARKTPVASKGNCGLRTARRSLKIATDDPRRHDSDPIAI